MLGRTVWRNLVLAAALTAAAAGCGIDPDAAANDDPVLDRQALAVTTTTAPATTGPATTTPPPTTTAATTLAPTPVAPPPSTTAAPPTTAPHPPRVVHEQPWIPYATVGPVTLHHPADQVEAIGFHQSGHDGAQQQGATASAARWFTMASRDRDTGPTGAADIVVPPEREIRVPVTGTVVRAGTYTLYCDNVDQYAVIEPDTRPGWEVKVLHVDGLTLAEGQRVEAGVTVLAAQARALPFPSQIEDSTGVPAWPHVHIEVVDPSILDRPTGPGCP